MIEVGLFARMLAVASLVVACVVACGVAPASHDVDRVAQGIGTRASETAEWRGLDTLAPSAGVMGVFDPDRRQVVAFGGGALSAGAVVIGNRTCLLDGRGWSCPPLALAPTRRLNASVVYDVARKRTLLLGGDGVDGGDRECWLWDGRRWSEVLGTKPPPRTSGALVYDGARERVVLFGGRDAQGRALDDTWIWDGAQWIEATPGARPPARYEAHVVYDSARQRVVLVGGRASGGVLGDTWLWDGGTWTSPPGSTIPARAGAGLVFDGRRSQAVLFGGRDTSENDLADTWTWDGTRWRAFTGSGPSGRYVGDQMVFDAARGQVVLFGGASTEFLGDSWIWDGTSWSSIATPSPAPSARIGALMVHDTARGQVILAGGNDAAQGFSDAWSWNGVGWSPVPSPAAPPARELASMVYDDARQRTVLFGGAGAQGAYLGDTWVWDGASWSAWSGSNGPSGRVGAAMVADPARSRVLLFGGGQAAGVLDDTWTWDGSGWSARSGPRPTARRDANLVFDATHGQALLFGGFGADGQSVAATALWDGSSWTMPVGDAPPARALAAVVHDPERGNVLLFGGRGGAIGGELDEATYLADTWTWSGAVWSRLTPRSAPSPRSYPQVAYDPVHRNVVLFGGLAVRGGVARYLDDTWLWDGTRWTEVMVDAPPPGRARAVFVADPDHGRLILTGGRSDGYALADTWLWDGDTWAAGVPSNAPSAYRSAAVYDRARKETVLFGGRDLTRLYGGTYRLSLAGMACTTPADCSGGACVDGVCCVQDACAPCERCDDAAARGTCTPVVSGTDADSCAGAMACNAQSVCRLALGEPCADAAACGSGACVDGVCCEDACEGQCEACNVPGAAGRCLPVEGKPRGARPDCEGAAAVSDLCARPACNGVLPDACSGTIGPCAPFACTLEGCRDRCTSDADCDASATCDVAIGTCRLRAAIACDGDHTLVGEGVVDDCTPYRCDGQACRDRCSSIAECAYPFECDATGSCVPPLGNVPQGACTVSLTGGARGGGVALVLGLVLVALARRRRARGGAVVALAMTGLCGCGNSRAEPLESDPAKATEQALGTTRRTTIWRERLSGYFVAGAAAAYDDVHDELVVFGGTSAAGVNLSETVILDADGYRRGVGTDNPRRPSARMQARMFFDPTSRKVVLVGGETSSGALSDTWLWDGSAWIERPADGPSPPASTASDGPPLFLDGTGATLLWTSRGAWLWDGKRWTRGPSDPEPSSRRGPALTYDADRRRVVLFGGTDAATGASLDDTWVFDGRVWSRLAGTMPPARTGALLAHDRVRKRTVLFGGEPLRTDTWTLDATGWRSEAPASSPPARTDARFFFDPRSGQAVLFGGRAGAAYLSDSWVWDGTWRERTTSAMGSASALSVVARHAARDRVVLLGGRDATTLDARTWTWEGDGWASIDPEPTPPARSLAHAVHDPARGEVLLFGGIDGGTAVASTWVWNGRWQARSSGAQPSARFFASLVYDAARQEIVLFGGQTGTGARPSDAMWRWNGAQWTAGPSGAGAPEPRTGPSMIYDTERREVILFGGLGPGGQRDETWRWNGTAWSLVDLPLRPPGRYLATFIHDPVRHTSLLFGGVGAGNSELSDSWLWNGSTWTQVQTPGPPGRSQLYVKPSAVYDTARQEVVLFGGASMVDGPRNDTWIWNGGAWRRHDGVAPPPRSNAAFVYDPDARVAVLFGGYGVQDDEIGDVWTWDGTGWASPTSIATPSARSGVVMVHDPTRRNMVLFGGYDNGERDDTHLLIVRGGACTSSAECANGTCVDGVCCGAQTCGTCERCDGDRPGTCTPVTGTDDADSCSGTSTCDARGRCEAVLGIACSLSSDCASGHCVDGVCCDRACGGVCEACDGAGSAGLCQPVRGAPHGDRPACPGADGDFADPCSRPACDGVLADRCGGTIGPCAPYACGVTGCTTECTSDQDCASAASCDIPARRCRANVDTPLCDGDHTLFRDRLVVTDCAPYKCEASSCKVRCTSIAECAYPFECSREGTCVPALTDEAMTGCATSPDGAGRPPSAVPSTFLMALIVLGATRPRRRRTSSTASRSRSGIDLGCTSDRDPPRKTPARH